MSSFAKKLRSTADHHLYLVKGFDFTGQHCWFFIKIPKHKEVQFDAMLTRHELTQLSDYGEIMLSGYGSEPTTLALEQIG